MLCIYRGECLLHLFLLLSLFSSMFAVWGSRTEGGSLYSARNLDWNKDTGVNKHKVVMVVVPDDGGIPSATLGFACLYGTLAGMSAKGRHLYIVLGSLYQRDWLI